MKNRAKCKLCESIIESFHRYDYVTCKCGEIAIDGGNDTFRCVVRNFDNFLRIDDEGNIIIPKVIDKEVTLDAIPIESKMPSKPTRAEMLDMLDRMHESILKMPQEAMIAPITHYDYASLILLLSAILREDDCKESS